MERKKEKGKKNYLLKKSEEKRWLGAFIQKASSSNWRRNTTVKIKISKCSQKAVAQRSFQEDPN